MPDPISYEQLIAFAAGELDGADASVVEEYLKTNPEAARTVARYRIIRSLYQSAPRDEPGARASTRARSIFRQRGGPKPHGNLDFRGLIETEIILLRRMWDSQSSRLTCLLHTLFLAHMPTHRISRSSRLLIALCILAIAGAAGTGGAMAQGSLPGETLYPVKRSVESFRLAVTYDDYERSELRLDFARERLRETRLLIADARYDRIQETLIAYEIHIDNATRGIAVRENATERALMRVSNIRGSLIELKHELEHFSGLGPDDIAAALARALDISDRRITALVELNRD